MGPRADGHAGSAMRALAKETGGRGGGRTEHAQGRVPTGTAFETVVRAILAAQGDAHSPAR